MLPCLQFLELCHRTCWGIIVQAWGPENLFSLENENFLLILGSDGGRIRVTPALLLDSWFIAMLVNLQMHSSICLFNSVELEQVSGSNQLALCILMVLL